MVSWFCVDDCYWYFSCIVEYDCVVVGWMVGSFVLEWKFLLVDFVLVRFYVVGVCWGVGFCYNYYIVGS